MSNLLRILGLGLNAAGAIVTPKNAAVGAALIAVGSALLHQAEPVGKKPAP